MTTLVYSPDNNLLISVSNNYLTHTITFYETKNYQEVNSFQGGTSGINNLAFGREGDIVAWIDADNVIKIYDIAKERVIQELKGHSGKVNCLSFNASGELLASGADDNNIVIWDAVTGRIVGTLEGHDGNVISIAFGPKDNQLASGDDNSIIKLWKITPELFRFQDNTSNISQTSIGQALNKDEQTVRKPDSKSTQYNASDTMLIATLKNHLSGVVSLTFLEGGNMLASFGLEDRSVKLWDLSQNNKIRHASIDTAFTKKAIARAENSFNLELEGTIIKIKATEFELL